ncbi:ATP-binding protein [Aneurinibacillus thermoaerophilus]|nr:ATP-binding protein [Aneurinibacillus thermoaerophilus]
MAFVKATKAKSRARIALCGPSGAGKTYTSLRLASGLGEKVAVIDTERGSASKYADEFEFDVMELDTFHPQKYIDGIKEAEAAGYDVLVIDSLSHAWMGKDGVLELHDRATAKQRTANSFAAWRDVTPIHNQLVDAILQSRLHVIVTMRSKTEYIQTEENGRKVVKKVGMAPVQRDGMEYEFDIVGDLDTDNNLIITKSRCRNLSGAVINKPGEETAQIIKDWLTDGVDIEEQRRKEREATLQRVLEAWETLSGDVDSFYTWAEKQYRKTKDNLTLSDLQTIEKMLAKKLEEKGA